MSLPKISVPTYTLTLPISKQKISFRPFTVKEEKNLVMVIQHENEESVLNMIINLLTDCTENKVEIEKLSLVDFQYLVMFLRAKSVGEEVEGRATCENCQKKGLFSLEIPKIVVKQAKQNNDEIKITPKIIIKMGPPTVKSSLLTFAIKDSELAEIAANVKMITIDGEVYDANNWTLPELMDFLERLPAHALKPITEYFKDSPRLVYTDEYTCPHCGHKQLVYLEGLENFFV